MQPNIVNGNEMDYGQWNEWDGVWTERKSDETWTVKCGLKEMRQNMNNEMWTEGNAMKHEQWSLYCNR